MLIVPNKNVCHYLSIIMKHNLFFFQFLNLTYNLLDDIQDGTFQPFSSSLEILRIYGNNLTTLRFEAFCCDNINTMLSRNVSLEIEIIERGSRSSSNFNPASNKDNLQEIEDKKAQHSISDQTWKCDQRSCWMKQLEKTGILVVGQLSCHSKPWPSLTEDDLGCYQDAPSCLYCPHSDTGTCGSEIDGTKTKSGTILSPAYDGFNMHAKNLNCKWIIQGGPGKKVHLKFGMMHIINSAQCTGDYLQISNVTSILTQIANGGNSGVFGKYNFAALGLEPLVPIGQNDVGRFCGSRHPGGNYGMVVNNGLTMTLVTDDRQEGLGFVASFEVKNQAPPVPSNYFECRNGVIIPSAQVCDGLWDCGDSTDEDVEHAGCEQPFICDNGTTVIPKDLVCDTHYDCKDRMDETGACEFAICENNDNVAIKWEFVCNGLKDCPDGEDESPLMGCIHNPCLSGIMLYMIFNVLFMLLGL